MPSSRTIALPLRNYASGEFSLPETNLPDWATEFAFEFARCTPSTPTIWPSQNTKLSFTMEFFVDGEWRFGGSFGAEGGIVTNPDDGSAEPISFARFRLPSGVGRKVRGSCTITDGPLRTEGSLELVS